MYLILINTYHIVILIFFYFKFVISYVVVSHIILYPHPAENIPPRFGGDLLNVGKSELRLKILSGIIKSHHPNQ